MKISKHTRLRFRHGGKTYALIVSSINYTGELIVNKLRLGHLQLWLIRQNGVWRFIGDMPLCRQLQTRLLNKIAALHGLPARPVHSQEETANSIFLLNATSHILTARKDLP